MKLAVIFLSIATIHKRNPFDLIIRNTFIPHKLVLSFDNTLNISIGVDLRIYLDYTSRAELVKRVLTLQEEQ
ncbi:hypothetical protein M406DRAFT_64842 [Cryphonectria parasitica EP155]|uniref:Uncharacterized protein n=1 Tax=Cryphonectria parasitica (strain ATCC 38755 / EP155) TaxID=660469 RepID=A0A9P4XVN4_CRYP1|nr:uncharacterized protein M406DRAFT_64842 [Cryphonectria parasitica EP155]KAF3761681.1 hypothetical protein M406DRAFT_64842 [Cryphonectria parasitica EP155]